MEKVDNNKDFKALEKKSFTGEFSDIPIRSSKRDLQVFRESTSWNDIVNHLLYSLLSLRDDLETLGEGHDRNEISYVQGQIFIIRSMLELPEHLEDLVKGEQKLNEKEGQ